MFLLWGLLLLGVVLVLYHWYQKNTYLSKTIEKYFQGPKTFPFLGNILEFPLGDEGSLSILMRFAKEYPERYRLKMGPNTYVLIYNANDVETLLSTTSHLIKSDVYKSAIPWIGYGLLISDGEKWKIRRKILTPTFHFKILEDFIDIFEANGRIFIDKLGENDGKPSFDVFPYCNLYALDNICETAMGISVHAQKRSDSTYVRAIKDMCNIVNIRTYRPWLMPDVLFNLSKHGKAQKECLKIIHGQTKETIQQRREALKTTKGRVDKDDFNQKRKLAFLDLLLQSAEASALTDEDIQEEVDTFMFEGHDTTTSGISFTLYALSQNPNIQEMVYQEQKEIFGDSNRPATAKDYNEMKYLERVLKESLRLYPAVPVYGRYIHEDLSLSDGAVLPKGVQAMLLTPALHRNPKLWENPENFDPDRFLPENTVNRSPYAHVPFSAGPRNCIGQRFAFLELKASVSKVVRHFKLLPCSEEETPKLFTEMVLISKNGVKLRVEKRNKLIK